MGLPSPLHDTDAEIMIKTLINIIDLNAEYHVIYNKTCLFHLMHRLSSTCLNIKI